MVTLRLTLLGGFDVRLSNGEAVGLRTKKARALLAYLGLQPGRAHQRDKLASLLWGNRTDPQARDGFRHSLAVLRKALFGVSPPPLVVEGQTIAVSAAAVEVDVASFERCVADATQGALERAAELYQGDLLLGLAVSEPLFEEWLIAERERLREIALEALARLLAQQMKSGRTEPAIQTAVRLLGLDPLQEPVHRSLMRLYDRLGRRGAALRHYQLCVSVLQRELGVEPEEETQLLHREIVGRRPVRTAASEPVTSGSPPPLVPIRRWPLVLATDTPLIGRQHEMARIGATLTTVVSGQGQVVAVIGEAGVGKTRLVAELAAEAAKMNGRVLIGRGHESEQILPFGPWVDALTSGRELVSDAWLKTVPLATRRELARLLPEFGPVEGEPAGPPDYLRLFEGVGILLGHVTAQQLVMLVLEDLHWADEMTVRLLAFIGRRLQAWPLLLIVTARDEDLAEAPMLQRTLNELEAEAHVAIVTLGPLSCSDTSTLVRGLARPGSDEGVMARLGEQVWRMSGGNPFVAIEAMRAAAHDALSPGLERLSLPERVHDLIGRRLDRFDERQRDLVALASVVGREFELELLQCVSGRGEEDTARGVEELIRRRVLHCVGGSLDFSHDRLREVAYSRILAPRRKVLHRRVAEAIVTLRARDIDLHHLALGLHCIEGEVWDKAVMHLRRSGVIAAEHSANREAVACFERALSALTHIPTSRETLEQAFDIRLELRAVLSRLGEIRIVLARLREAESLAEQLNDDRRRGLACAFLANVYSWLGEMDAALASGTRALTIASALDDVELRVLATTYLAQAHYHRGDYEQAAQLASDNLAVSRRGRDHSGEVGVPSSVYDRVWLVLGHAHLGRFSEAEDQAGEMIRLAESTQHGYTLCSAYYSASVLQLLKGDWAKARSVIDPWIEVARARNLARHLAYAIAWSAWASAEMGHLREARSQLSEGEQLLELQPMMGHVGTLGWDYHALGRASLLLHQIDEARRLTDRGLQWAPLQFGFAAYALHLAGDIASCSDRFDAENAEAQYRRALALAEPRGMRPLVAHCHLGLSNLYARTGKRDQAKEHFTTGTTMYRQMGMTYWLEKAEAELK